MDKVFVAQGTGFSSTGFWPNLSGDWCEVWELLGAELSAVLEKNPGASIHISFGGDDGPIPHQKAIVRLATQAELELRRQEGYDE